MIEWPVVLADGPLRLRPLRHRDARAWREVRARSADWLKPWDATLPPESRSVSEVPPTFGSMVRRLNKEAREGRALPWAMEYEGAFCGQLTVGGISWGSLRSAYIGYWIDADLAGRGVTTTAVAMACDYLFDRARLHRIEINIRPENASSRRVVEKLGFREEGLRPAYLHIDGDWRDHQTYVLFAGDQSEGVLMRLRNSHQ